MNKTSTYIGIVGIILVIASVIYTYKFAPIKPENTFKDETLDNWQISTTTIDDSNSVNDERVKTYFDPTELFTFDLPERFNVLEGASVAKSDWRVDASAGEMGTVKAILVIPKSYASESGLTNFSDAKFTISFGANQKSLDNCMIDIQGESWSGYKAGTKDMESAGSVWGAGSVDNVSGVKQNQTVKIGGIDFKKFESGGAGAGNFYETTSYRAVRAGQCIAIEYTIHTTNIGAYSPEQNIKEFTIEDKAKLKEVLDTITKSVKFSF